MSYFEISNSCIKDVIFHEDGERYVLTGQDLDWVLYHGRSGNKDRMIQLIAEAFNISQDKAIHIIENNFLEEEGYYHA